MRRTARSSGRQREAIIFNIASRQAGKAGRDKKARPFTPHPRDAEHVRSAFEQDEKHPERRRTVTPEELDRWADTGEWPEAWLS